MNTEIWSMGIQYEELFPVSSSVMPSSTVKISPVYRPRSLQSPESRDQGKATMLHLYVIKPGFNTSYVYNIICSPLAFLFPVYRLSLPMR